MTISLTLMSSYSSVELALVQEKSIIKKIRINHKNASKELMASLAQLLTVHELRLENLSYIAVNQGPGPFTTLRTVIASANGLAFATNIPLIGIDALSAMLDKFHNSNFAYTTVILNAFSGDIYYGVRKEQQKERPVTGYQNAQVFLQELAAKHPAETMQFVGGGVELYEKDIKNFFGTRAVIPEPLPEYCSLEKMTELAYEKWQNQEDMSKELFPLYLKTHSTRLQI